MKYSYIKFSITALATLGLFTACEPEIERERPDYDQVRGEADFSVYVALGNSLTAGYADRALNRHNQLNSYPAIMADKMASLTPEFEFDQPLVPEGIADGTLEFKGLSANGQPNIVPSSGGLTNEQVFARVSGSFNNMGVPGAKSYHLVTPGYAQANPYFGRFASADNATVLNDAAAQNPTFFTLWIGNNDVLGYALAGGVEETDPITEVDIFEASLNTIVDELTSGNNAVEGAIANIPSITKIPYFTTVHYNQLALNAEQAELANQAYQQNIDPQVRSGVDSVAKTQVIRGVIETGTRQQIEAQVRPAVAPVVAQQIIYNQAYEYAISQGADDDQAKASAQAHVESAEGQQQISDLEASLLDGTAPEEAQAAYEGAVQNQIEVTYNSENIQNQMDATFESAINNMNDLTSVLGPQGAGAVEAVFSSDDVVAKREAAFNQQISQLKAAGFYPVFKEGPNPFVMVDDNPQNPLGIRQMREGELVLLTALTDGQLTAENAAQPKPDRYILDANEIANINETISAYNVIIDRLTTENTLALVDMNSFFEQVAQGLTIEGTTFTTAFVTGNAFSLDGVHMTQRGYALIAKKFIQDINSYYGSKLPEPKLANYPTLGLPANN